MARKIIKSKYYSDEGFVEIMAEVPAEGKMKPWASNEDLKVVGKPVSRLDGYDKVSGSAIYTFDVKLPGMAYAKTLRCPYPSAKIKKIDISKAREYPGVLAVITHENSAKIPWYWGTTQLFDNNLRFEGDEVACLAAESEQIAEDALKLIEVEYEVTPFSISAEDAMKPEAHKIHDWGNIVMGRPEKYTRGDADKGFAEADLVVEDTFTTQVVVHNPTEVHCSVVSWDGDKLTVWDSTQGIWAVRETVAQSLNMPASKVRVIKKYMGGGFGSKLEAGKYTVMAALLAREIGRPVRIALDRREQNLAVGNRPDSVQKLKVGAKKDGTITALSHNSYGSVGAYPNGAGCAWPLRTLYKCPNVNIEEHSIITNTGRSRAFRAPGHVQGTFALESLIDEMAEKLNMNPLEFRIKNYAEKDQNGNNPYTSKFLMEAYKKGAEEIRWKEKWQPAGSSKGTIKKGLGMASQIWWGGGAPPAYATMKLNQDGSLQVLSGTQDLGTGTYTFVAQIASEVLEIPLNKIQVTLGDTDSCPFGTMSGGSMTAPSVSPAVRDAAEQMKRKLISGAAAIMETPEDNIEYNDGVMRRKDDPSKKIEIPELIDKLNEQVLITTGAREANPQGYDINTFGAQFAEVEVDTLTGQVRVVKIVAAHDTGRVLNPKTYNNQVHGGVIQGLGQALLEERIMDKNTGKVLNTNIHDYKLPTIMDIPEIKVISVNPGDELLSSTGVKGVGEPAIIPTLGAIANAVYNAIGVRIKSLPITPDKVLMALNDKLMVSDSKSSNSQNIK